MYAISEFSDQIHLKNDAASYTKIPVLPTINNSSIKLLFASVTVAVLILHLCVPKHKQAVMCKDCRGIKYYLKYSKTWTSSKENYCLFHCIPLRQNFTRHSITKNQTWTKNQSVGIKCLLLAVELGEQKLWIWINTH